MKKVLPGICMFATLLVGALAGCTPKECAHQEETIAGVAATCTEKGLTEGKKCSICQEILVAQEEIAALGHTEEKFEGKAPTCTEDGMVAYTHCTVCGENFDAEGNKLEKLTIDALGHTTETVAEKAPTCTEEGNVAYTHCSVCGENFDAEGNKLENVTVEALGHTYIDGKCECGDEYTVATCDWTLVTEIKDGDNVLIGVPAYGKLLSVEKVSAGSYYNRGVDYSANDFTNVTDAETFTVTANADGSYTFTSLTGKVIALADQYSSLNDTGANKSWALEERSEGLYYLKNTGRNMYLEWYNDKNNWSAFGTINAGSESLFEMSFYAKGEATDGEHVHNYISDIKAATCTEDGLATYTCSCEDSFTKVLKATGHSYENGRCGCGELDPEHEHSYTSEEVAPTCQVVGHTKYTCICGDTYTEDGTELADHVDANLDITCDYEGCTERILPAADSEISLFTANHMIIVSLNSNYYLKGVVTEITDTLNGFFIITDEAGDHLLIRLPKDSEGNSYTKWATKIVVGDTVQVYGKPSKNIGAPATEKAKVESGVVTILKHEHNFSEPTCTKPAECACSTLGAPALGHIDENADNACDRCTWNMKLVEVNIGVSTKVSATNGVLAEDKTSWTWSSENFDVIIAKGTSTFTLYTSEKDYMQLKKLNTLTVDNKNGAKIHSITISTTNPTQLTNLKNAIGTQYECTVDEAELTVTIVLDSTEDFVMTNVGTTTAYVSGVTVVYEK